MSTEELRKKLNQIHDIQNANSGIELELISTLLKLKDLSNVNARIVTKLQSENVEQKLLIDLLNEQPIPQTEAANPAEMFEQVMRNSATNLSYSVSNELQTLMKHLNEEQEINELKQEIESLQIAMKLKDEEINKLERQLRTSVEMDNMNIEELLIMSDLKDNFTELMNTTNDSNTIESKINKLTIQINKQQSKKLKKVQDELEELQQKTSTNVGEIRKEVKIETLSDLSKLVESCVNDSAIVQDEYGILNTNLEHLQKEIKMFFIELLDAIPDEEDLTRIYNKKIEKLKREISNNNKAFHKKNKIIAKMKHEKTQQKHGNKDNETINKLKQQLENYRKLLCNVSDVDEDVVGELQRKMNMLLNPTNEDQSIESIQNDLYVLWQQVRDKTQETFDQKKKVTKDKIKSLKKHIKHQNHTIDQLNQVQEQLEMELESKNNYFGQLEADNNESVQEINRLREESMKLKQLVDQLTYQLDIDRIIPIKNQNIKMKRELKLQKEKKKLKTKQQSTPKPKKKKKQKSSMFWLLLGFGAGSAFFYYNRHFAVEDSLAEHSLRNCIVDHEPCEMQVAECKYTESDVITLETEVYSLQQKVVDCSLMENEIEHLKRKNDIHKANLEEFQNGSLDVYLKNEELLEEIQILKNDQISTYLDFDNQIVQLQKIVGHKEKKIRILQKEISIKEQEQSRVINKLHSENNANYQKFAKQQKHWFEEMTIMESQTRNMTGYVNEEKTRVERMNQIISNKHQNIRIAHSEMSSRLNHKQNEIDSLNKKIEELNGEIFDLQRQCSGPFFLVAPPIRQSTMKDAPIKVVHVTKTVDIEDSSEDAVELVEDDSNEYIGNLGNTFSAWSSHVLLALVVFIAAFACFVKKITIPWFTVRIEEAKRWRRRSDDGRLSSRFSFKDFKIIKG